MKKIVLFDNGDYGIRKGIFSYYYYDFKTVLSFWWSIDSHNIKDCKTTLENAVRRLKILNSTKPIKHRSNKPKVVKFSE